MGALIVLGAAVVAVELFRRAGDQLTMDRADEFATTTVALPPGDRVVGMAGGGDALSLLVEGADGGRRIVTVDRRSGAILGELTLTSGM